MARKDKFELSDLDLDRSLDMPDFDFTMKEPAQKGKPIFRVAQGARKGFFNALKSSAFVRATLVSALPRGYGEALSFADKSIESFKDLYDTGVREIKPQLNELARITKRALPEDATKDSDLMKRLRKFANSHVDESGKSDVDPQEAMLANVLGEVFDAQQKMDDRRTKVADIKDQVRENLTQMRHRDMVNQLDAIRRAAVQQTAYTTTVNANYQRRALELQYRHYFLSMQMLAETKRSNAVVEANLKGILYNTALPEQAKYNASGSGMRELRNHFLGGMAANLFGRNNDYARRLMDSLKKRGVERIYSVANAMRGATTAADMGLDAMQMAREMGVEIDPFDEAGQGLGRMGALGAGRILGSLAAPYLRRFPGISRTGNKLQYWLENAGPLMQQWARSDKGEKGLLGHLTRFLKTGVIGMEGIDTRLQKDSHHNLTEAAAFDRGAHRSITEVIPGYLARIYRELQVMRTGNAQIGLTEYDYSKGDFVSRSEHRQSLFNAILPKQAREWTQQDLDRLIDRVEDKAQPLTKEQRALLKKQLLRDALHGRGGLSSRMTDAASYTGSAAPHAAVYQAMFKKHFAQDADKEKEYEFAHQFQNLGRYAQDTRALIQELALRGQLPFLQSIGIVDETGSRIDLERLADYYAGEEYVPGAVSGVEGPVQRFRARRQSSRKVRPIRWSHESAARAQSSFTTHMAAPPPPAEQDDPLIQVVRQESVKSETIQILEVLKAIRERVDSGIPTMQIPPELWEQMKDGYGNVKARIRSLLSRLKGYGLEGITRAKHLAGRGLGHLRSLNRAFDPLGWAKKGWSYATDKARGFADVYVKGEAIPRLKAWKLKAGHYRDEATGKVIQHWKDITSRVVDEDGNIVLDFDDVKNAFVKSSVGEKLLSALGASTAFALKTGKQVLGALSGGYGKLAGFAYRKLNEYLDGPEDVYVKGQKEPALLARLMRMGVYFDRDTKSPVRKTSDIKGVVVDQDDNVVLSLDQIKAGLVDKYGRPLTSKLGRLGRLLNSALGGGLGMFKEIGRRAFGMVSGVRDFFGGLFQRFAGKDGIVFSGSKKIVNVLEEIRDMLDDRLPGRKIRVGSLEDLRAKRKAKEADHADGSGQGATRAGQGMVGGLLSKLAGFFKRKKKDEEEESSSGLLSKLVDYLPGKRFLKGAGRFLLRNKGLLAKGALGAAAGYGLAKGANGLLGTQLDPTTAAEVGGVATTALPWAARLLPAALPVAGTLGSLALGAGGALLSALASPVVLGAAGVAALGAGAYYGYQYLTRDKLDTLSKLRYVQYGFAPTDTSNVHKVFALETLMKPAVFFTAGAAMFNTRKLDMGKVMDIFGIDKGNQAQVQHFATWLVKRFKPVYLLHRSVLNTVSSGTDLSEVDSKLKGEVKLKYFDGVKFPSGPYDVLDSPDPSLTQLPSNRAAVQAVIQETDAILKKEAGEKKDAKGFFGKMMDAFALTPVGMVTKAITSVASSIFGSSQPEAQAGGDKLATQVGKAVSASTTVTGPAAGLASLYTGMVNALDAIRFKTYGLKSLEVEKVNALSRLEKLVELKVSFGSSKSAQFTGNVDDICQAAGPLFGIQGVANKAAYNWKAWFNLRFLPAYLNYRTGLKAATGKEDASIAQGTLKARDAFNLAQLVMSTTTEVNGSTVSVWTIPISPWPDYELNAEVGSIQGNLKSLQDAIKQTTLQEKTAQDTKPSAANDAAKSASDLSKTQAAGSTSASLWDSLKNKAASAGSWISQKASALGSGVMDTLKSAGSAVAGAAGAVGNTIASGARAAWEGAKSVGSGIAKVVSVSAAKVKDALMKAMAAAGITNPTEQAMFMAQMDHESGGFKSLSENLNYRASSLMKVFRKYFSSEADAQATAQAGPEAIANRVYGGRMGNTAPGDGFKYRGRGVIQLTGKANYERYGKMIGVDLVNNPDLASDPDVAAKIAVAYWRDRVPSQAAQQGDIQTVTKRINGGLNGLDDRSAKFRQYLALAKSGGLAAAGAAAGAAAPSVSGADTKTGTTQAGASNAGAAPAAQSMPKGPDMSAGTGGAVPPAATPSPTPVPSAGAPDAGGVSLGFSDASFVPTQQSKVRQDGGTASFTEATNYLKQSVSIEAQQLDVLQQILRVLSATGKAAAASSAQPAEGDVASGGRNKPLNSLVPSDSPTPPIPLKRKTFA